MRVRDENALISLENNKKGHRLNNNRTHDTSCARTYLTEASHGNLRVGIALHIKYLLFIVCN